MDVNAGWFSRQEQSYSHFVSYHRSRSSLRYHLLAKHTFDAESTVAKSAYYKRLWAYFSVKSLINIGSRGLQVFGLVVKVVLFLLYCMSYCFKVLELKKKDHSI